MKKRLALLLALLSLAFFCACACKEKSAPELTLGESLAGLDYTGAVFRGGYSNKALGLSVQAPGADWRVAPDIRGALARFTPPSRRGEGPAPYSVLLKVRSLTAPAGVDVEKAFDHEIGKYPVGRDAAAASEQYSLEIVRDEPPGGGRSWTVVRDYRPLGRGERLVRWRFYRLLDGRLYSLETEMPADRWPEARSGLDRMAESLKILPPAPQP